MRTCRCWDGDRPNHDCKSGDYLFTQTLEPNTVELRGRTTGHVVLDPAAFARRTYNGDDYAALIDASEAERDRDAQLLMQVTTHRLFGGLSRVLPEGWIINILWQDELVHGKTLSLACNRALSLLNQLDQRVGK